MRKEKFGVELLDYLHRCKDVARETNKSVVYMFNGCINNIPFNANNARAYRKLLAALADGESALLRVMTAYEELEAYLCC